MGTTSRPFRAGCEAALRPGCELDANPPLDRPLSGPATPSAVAAPRELGFFFESVLTEFSEGDALAIAGVAIASAVVVWWIPFEQHRRILESRLSEAIGLELRIGGELRFGLFPDLHFEATDVTVANLPGRPSPHLLEIGRLSLTVSGERGRG